jgi:hypothetical protein
MFFVKKNSNTRYVFVFGGLGNQLFQYALAYFIYDNGVQNVKLVNCTGLFEVRRRYCLQNGEFETVSPPKYQLFLLFSILYLIKFLPFPKLKKCLGIYYDGEVRIQDDLKSIKKMRFFYGYWQEFALAKSYSDKIDSLFDDVEHLTSKKNVIGVHCRRGDFINNEKAQKHNVTNIEYFERGVKQALSARPKCKVKVFTDDKEWCIKNLSFAHMNNTFSDHSELGEVRDFMHLKSSSSFVLSNSTFGWWASYASKCDDKTIVLPDMWLSNLSTRQTRLYDEEAHFLLTVQQG